MRKLICKYKQSFDFNDHKGWDATVGVNHVGMIIWFSDKHELVVNDGHKTGFSFNAEDAEGDGYETLEQAQLALEEAVFGEQALMKDLRYA